MKIGVIGAGNIGANLVRRFRRAGHDVAVANSRGPETLGDLAAETGATPVHAADAARDAEVVVLTIPLRAVADLPDDLLDGAAPDAAIIDTNNYYTRRDGNIAPIDAGQTSSAWVAEQLGRPVNKVFNGIYAHNIIDAARPKGDPDRLALPIAGDDEAAKARVMDLVDEIGFDPVDAGSLAESWRQEPGTPSYGPELKADELRRALADAEKTRG